MSFTPTTQINPQRFAKQVAVVTGAGSGIGAGIAQRLYNEGASVALLDINEEAVQKVASVLKLSTHSKSSTAAVTMHSVDVTDEASVKRTIDEVLAAHHNQIDIVVNSAGITGATGKDTEHVDLADFRKVYAINVDGTFLLCKYVLPGMKQRNYGRIVNMASISGKEGNAQMLAYSSSKAAVIGLTKVIGKEVAHPDSRITVNCIAPAVVQTAMVDALPEDRVNYMTAKIPMKRTGKIEEIAAMAAFIASPECSFSTGGVFDASGGRATY